jgi:hypothetical protein
MLPGLLALAHATVELAEAEVAVGDEEAYADYLDADNVSSNAFASRRSAVSKPSVNQP